MKSTLLEITQDILNDMSSDVINTIDDTDEAIQVAQIVKSTYQAMMSNRNWPHTKRIINLVSSGDNLFPTHMGITEDIKEMVNIFYDKRRNTETRLRFEEVKWLEPDDFLRFTNKRNSDNPNVQVIIDHSGVKILIQNDKAPTYYTSFDDKTLVFDSFDELVDDTLQANKTQARAYVVPIFEMVDNHIPDLPDEAFAALIEEAKSKAMFKLKQTEDSKAEQEATRQRRWLSRKDWTVKGGIRYPNYGRNRARSYNGKDPTFRNEN